MRAAAAWPGPSRTADCTDKTSKVDIFGRVRHANGSLANWTVSPTNVYTMTRATTTTITPMRMRASVRVRMRPIIHQSRSVPSRAPGHVARRPVCGQGKPTSGGPQDARAGEAPDTTTSSRHVGSTARASPGLLWSPRCTSHRLPRSGRQATDGRSVRRD